MSRIARERSHTRIRGPVPGPSLLLAFALALVLLPAALASGQRIDDPEMLEELGLSESEIESIREIQDDAESVLREARVELNLLKARLEKLLLDVNVDMQRVEQLIRESVEWKIKSELAEIRRRVEIRKIFGEERWEEFLRRLNRMRGAQRGNPPPQKGRQ